STSTIGRASPAVATRQVSRSAVTCSSSCEPVKRMKAKTPPSVPGPESRRIFAEEQRLIAPGLQRIALMSELTLASGRGATVEDVDGNRYVDFFAGVAVASLGHTHPHWVTRMEAQIRKISVGSFTTENRLRFLKRLAQVTPG